MSEPSLLRRLRRHLDAAPPGALRVAYSGGIDSTVLLHAFSCLDVARARDLRAVHVDHGLSPDARRWAEHCRVQARDYGVPLQVIEVRVGDIDEYGLEGAARRVRHAALAAVLGSGEVLAMAHHRQDQAETVLLRLLHGAGTEGCAGMRSLRRSGDGWLWRPLLDTDRAEIEAYAEANSLIWIADPSNEDPRHARSLLRHQVLPALRSRWPDAERRLGAAARRLRSEADALEALAQQALAQAQGTDPATLSIDALREWPTALGRIVIGRWLDTLGLPRPPPGIWPRLDPELLGARPDASPCVAWRGAELRRYRGLLYAMRPRPEPQYDWRRDWDGDARLSLPEGFGTLSLEPPCRLEPALIVRPREGGERLRQSGAHRELRTLLQDLGVPPWVRARLPLVCAADGELLAAGDLALNPGFAQRLAALGTCLRWDPGASIPADRDP